MFPLDFFCAIRIASKQCPIREEIHESRHSRCSPSDFAQCAAGKEVSVSAGGNAHSMTNIVAGFSVGQRRESPTHTEPLS
jgi:hypothetical protein